ncbi:hypothetical protein GCM10027445_58380 [Amycolatopsis endophytica]|uniref:Serine kinase n=1 Tax=Amycolatopsis endophytica TaxID=860233 RepID=A0A853AZK5_9PSEU|nr:hypothetical protein [Amycolatopsis endophytica]NYI87926.1 hypothetical protein [Amycolatopsis endophytica]
MDFTYQAHGLTIWSDVELALPQGDGGEPDLVLRRGADRAVPDSALAGRRRAELAKADGRVFFTLATSSDGTVLRYPGLCDFVGDPLLREVTYFLDPSADHGLLTVLATGALLAVHLTLNSHLVLHASAVRVGSRALAFVGASGMGKSTLAAAFCGRGCSLVADDVLRVDPDGTVYPGSTENRLRMGARLLADAAPASDVRATADGRLALRSSVAAGALPLAGCVIPRPSRDAERVSVERLAGARAFVRMSQFPRVLGWRDPVVMDLAFQWLADLVQRVPVYEAVVPWGPPFSGAVLDELLTAVSG